jgi:Transcriptional regulators
MMPPKEGLHRGQIHLLFLISKNDGVIQRDLAEMMDMRPSSLTEMLTNLEQNSLITRKQDEKDRRVIHVYLTDNGKSAIDGFIQANDELSNSFFSCLTTEEKEKMLEIVNKINTNIESMVDNASGERHECSDHEHGCHSYHKHHHKFDEE